ncbi:transcription elongation factor GreB [Stutzerimonas urumqiensis]|uniref:transcription elongation factor GreB n=1 Tax=Stutzerimonas urumqiensis TaxID=638269 RepID=UPI003BA94F45
MSRYRPPRTAGTPLITPEGEARLRAELHELWHVRRPQVTQAVSEAAALGDRSENAEYIYGKKMLREIDSRVRFLTKRLEKLKVVSERPSDPGKVYFGAWITLEDEAGEQTRYRIVGPDELDLKQGLISIDSPLARALVGKPLDAEVLVQTPTGTRAWYIVAIEYRDQTFS